MENFKNKYLGNIVAMHPHTAKVFKQYKMDFCCGGEISLQDICAKKNVALEEIEPKLNEAIAQAILPKENFNNFELSKLVTQIESVYHRKVRTDIPGLQQNLDKVVRVHGEGHPHLPAIRILFEKLVIELTNHIKKQEEVLFPLIRGIKGELDADFALKMEAEIKKLHDENHAAGAIMAEICVLTGNYTPPEGACRTYRLVYQLLEDFEETLQMLFHLENNILFAKIK